MRPRCAARPPPPAPSSCAPSSTRSSRPPAGPASPSQTPPLRARLHPAKYGPFRIFRFEAHQQPDIVYSESITRAHYIDKPDETVAYAQALDRISAQAAPGDDTATLLHNIRKEIKEI